MESRVVSGYHVHIYYREADGPAAAKALRDAIAERFEVELGLWRDTPGGPHPAPMFQVNFAVDLFAAASNFLGMQRLSISNLPWPR